MEMGVPPVMINAPPLAAAIMASVRRKDLHFGDKIPLISPHAGPPPAIPGGWLNRDALTGFHHIGGEGTG